MNLCEKIKANATGEKNILAVSLLMSFAGIIAVTLVLLIYHTAVDAPDYIQEHWNIGIALKQYLFSVIFSAISIILLVLYIKKCRPTFLILVIVACVFGMYCGFSGVNGNICLTTIIICIHLRRKHKNGQCNIEPAKQITAVMPILLAAMALVYLLCPVELGYIYGYETEDIHFKPFVIISMIMAAGAVVMAVSNVSKNMRLAKVSVIIYFLSYVIYAAVISSNVADIITLIEFPQTYLGIYLFGKPIK